MDQNNVQNSSGMMNGMPPQVKTEKKVGPIVGALIIILVLIIAALYFFGQKLNTEAPSQELAPVGETSMNNSDSMTASAAKSDDVTSLEADLNAELKDIDYSF